MPVYQLPIEVRDHRTQAVLVRATDVVFGGGLIGSFMRLFGGDQDYEFLSCGYVSPDIGPWRPSLSTRARVGHYERADTALVLAAHGIRAAPTPPLGVPLRDVTAVVRGLAGSWKRDVTHDGVPAVEAVELDISGGFSEVITVPPNVPVRRRSGMWSYDGTNFWRTVTSIDRKRLTKARFIYERFELKSLSEREFVATSHEDLGEVHYSRSGRTH